MILLSVGSASRLSSPSEQSPTEQSVLDASVCGCVCVCVCVSKCFCRDSIYCHGRTDIAGLERELSRALRRIWFPSVLQRYVTVLSYQLCYEVILVVQISHISPQIPDSLLGVRRLTEESSSLIGLSFPNRIQSGHILLLYIVSLVLQSRVCPLQARKVMSHREQTTWAI